MAAAGDAMATITWAPPTSDGGAAVSGYTVTSSPGSKTCTTTGTSCVVLGLTNGTTYQFSVTARNSAGASGASTMSASVTPGPPVVVLVKAVSRNGKLSVNVNPDKGAGFWKFRVQKQDPSGSWSNAKAYKTKGKKETRTINLTKGVYRVVVESKYGFLGSTSTPVTLVK
jgi:chitodextrinase